MSTQEPDEDRKLKCEEIQSVLFEYMTRELGEGQSRLAREHLRHCPDCSRAAVEIQKTLDFLRRTSRDRSRLPEKLSEERRERIRNAVSHPVRHWIEEHHGLVSILVAVLVLLIAFLVLRKARVWERRKLERGIPVLINRLPDVRPATNAPPREETP